MADIKASALKRTNISWLDPRILKVQPDLNARAMTDPEVVAHVEWLAQSIAVEGVKKPLEVFSEGDSIYVADGHCRLAGTMLAISRGADIASVPCIPETKGANDVDRRLNQILSNSGKALTPLEAGVAIKYAIGKGWSVEQIARKLGRSASYVHGALDLQGADASIHESVKAGEISATAAVAVVRAEKANAPAVIRAAIETAKAEGKTKATAKTIATVSPRSAPRRAEGPSVVSFSADDAKIKPPSSVSQELTITIKGVVLIAHKSAWEALACKVLDTIDAMPKGGV